jgi:predicted acylesterase/phospholipase RssA
MPEKYEGTMPKKHDGSTESQEGEEVTRLVGLSLGACVSEILSGKVKEEEVEMIITSTDVSSQEDWDRVIDKYKNSSWLKDPAKGEAIARRFINDGKIRQPRQEGGVAHNIDDGLWINADEVDDWEKQQTENE